jgi:hypothetical protein
MAAVFVFLTVVGVGRECRRCIVVIIEIAHIAASVIDERISRSIIWGYFESIALLIDCDARMTFYF